MIGDVFLTDRAVADFDAALAYYKQHSEELARRWCTAVEQAVADLETDPGRFAIALEEELLRLNLRQINFGIGRQPSHRMVFAIRPDRVVVYTLRGLKQADLKLDDLI